MKKLSTSDELAVLEAIEEASKVPRRTAVIDNGDGTYRPMSHEDWPPMQKQVMTEDDIKRIYELTGRDVIVFTTPKNKRHD